MDTNIWRPNQGTKPSMDNSDWRGQLPPESRQIVVNQIMDTLRHLPGSGQERLHALWEIAQSIEEEFFTAATSQDDYHLKESSKLLSLETKFLGNEASNLPSDQVCPSNQPLDPASKDSTAQTGVPSGSDWQEEVYQKIKTMKESYLPELFQFTEMYHNCITKLGQHDSLPPEKSDKLTKLNEFRKKLDQIMASLLVSKRNISLDYKERLGSLEKHIINFINTYRPRRAMSSLQPGQHPPTHMHSMSQPQSQVNQVQTTNILGSAATMQQNSVTSMRQSSMFGVSTAQQNTMNSIQPVTNLDSGQGNAMNSLQQVPVSSLQPNPVSAPQLSNSDSLSSQGGVNVIQSNLNPLQEGSSMLQHQQLKQQQEQQMLQNQQYHQRQLMQRQQILQQQQQVHQPAKQQLSVQSQTHKMQRLRQTNDVNDTKVIQGIGVKPGAFQQHLTSSPRSAYPLKQGSPFPVSTPHLAASPQIPQHSSPQVDQGNHPPSLTKVSTPLQSANSTFVGPPTSSPPLAPSPMSGDSKKPISGVSLMSSAAYIGHQKTSSAAAPAQSLAIGNPGISASPLLAEFSGPDGPHGNALAPTSGLPTVTDQPIALLIKVIKSLSEALSAAVRDISSVVSTNDRMAGSPPGNGSRVAVGQDLVAVTNCHLQARDFTTQDVASGTRRMKRYADATPLKVVSSAGSMNASNKQLTALESTAISSFKKPRIEANCAFLEEIRKINQRHIDTVVDTSDEEVDPTSAAAAAAEGAEGIIVKCSYVPVALSPSLKSQYASAQMSQIQPLRLFVPTNYPNCSPILLDKIPVESSMENEDLSEKVRVRFSKSLRSLSEPMSLGEIAKNWGICAHSVICEHAQLQGGGTFSSKYGTWEDCLTSA